jgi:hypothetical protein
VPGLGIFHSLQSAFKMKDKTGLAFFSHIRSAVHQERDTLTQTPTYPDVLHHFSVLLHQVLKWLLQQQILIEEKKDTESDHAADVP